MGSDTDPIRTALRDARLALEGVHNCLVTDRPDLPRAPNTGWTTDFRRQLAAIDAAEACLPPIPPVAPAALPVHSISLPPR